MKFWRVDLAVPRAQCQSRRSRSHPRDCRSPIGKERQLWRIYRHQFDPRYPLSTRIQSRCSNSANFIIKLSSSKHVFSKNLPLEPTVCPLRISAIHFSGLCVLSEANFVAVAWETSVDALSADRCTELSFRPTSIGISFRRTV